MQKSTEEENSSYRSDLREGQDQLLEEAGGVFGRRYATILRLKPSN